MYSSAAHRVIRSVARTCGRQPTERIKVKWANYIYATEIVEARDVFCICKGQESVCPPNGYWSERRRERRISSRFSRKSCSFFIITHSSVSSGAISEIPFQFFSWTGTELKRSVRRLKSLIRIHEMRTSHFDALLIDDVVEWHLIRKFSLFNWLSIVWRTEPSVCEHSCGCAAVVWRVMRCCNSLVCDLRKCKH